MKKNSNSSIKAIIFDLGDTLIETKALMRLAAEYATHKLYLKQLISNEQVFINTFFKVDSETHIAHINHLFSHIEIVQRSLEESRVVEIDVTLSELTIASIFLAHYRNKIRESIRPQKHLISLFKKLRENNLKLGIISNGTLQEQIEVLIRLGIVGYFDDIIISEEVGFEKPDPYIFKIATKRLGVEPRNALFIGDNFETDVLGSLSIGLQAVLSIQYNNKFIEPKESEPASRYMIIEDIENVLNILKIT